MTTDTQRTAFEALLDELRSAGRRDGMLRQSKLYPVALAAVLAAFYAARGTTEEEFERGRQQGMTQERALWNLAALGQEIEATPRTTDETVNPSLHYTLRPDGFLSVRYDGDPARREKLEDLLYSTMEPHAPRTMAAQPTADDHAPGGFFHVPSPDLRASTAPETPRTTDEAPDYNVHGGYTPQDAENGRKIASHHTSNETPRTIDEAAVVLPELPPRERYGEYAAFSAAQMQAYVLADRALAAPRSMAAQPAAHSDWCNCSPCLRSRSAVPEAQPAPPEADAVLDQYTCPLCDWTGKLPNGNACQHKATNARSTEAVAQPTSSATQVVRDEAREVIPNIAGGRVPEGWPTDHMRIARERAQPEVSERERFESWAAEDGIVLDETVDKWHEKIYDRGEANKAWRAWQAALAPRAAAQDGEAG